MNLPIDLAERFVVLAREVPARPGFARHVLDRDEAEWHRSPSARSRLSRVPRSWRIGVALAAASLVAFSIWLVSQPRSLSAQMFAALADVESVHVIGSTARVVRKWPLEDPAAANAEPAHVVPFEAWYWNDEHGVPRSYERQGPVTLTRRGGEMREYQQDADLLYVFEGGYVKDRVRDFSQLAGYLVALDRPGMAKRSLGTRRQGGMTLAGLELRQGGRVQTVWWNVATMLPLVVSASEPTADGKMLESHLAIQYNQAVPAEVVDYQPPQAANLRYAGSDQAALAWHEHVAEIGRQLQHKPLESSAKVLPRTRGRLFSHSWTLPTPDGKYKVTPLCGRADDLSTLADFIRLQVARDSDPPRRLATWRVPEEFCDLVYRHDVVYRADADWREWVQTALAHFGLEFVDVEETRTFWVAHHDPRSGKPAGPVRPPVPYIVEGGVEKKGLVKGGVGFKLSPVTLEALFADFNTLQARDMRGESIIIDDQTALPPPPKFDPKAHGTWEAYFKNVVEPKYPMATDSPYFQGAGSLDMARKWYRDEFGITFTEETRPVTVHVVRRKQP